MSIKVRVFRNDESGYLAWLKGNLIGWVVNVPYSKGGIVVRHRSTCKRIGGDKRSNWTGPHYYKVVSESQDALARWVDANWSGNLRACSFCTLEEAVVSRRPIPSSLPTQSRTTQPRLDSKVYPLKASLPLWSIGRPMKVLQEIEPQIASWDRKEHASQVRLKTYLTMVREYFAPVLVCGEKLAVSLIVDLKREDRLYRGNDVENYVTPLVQGLGWRNFVYAEVEKRVGGGSCIAIGPAVPCIDAPVWSGWGGRMVGSLVALDGKRSIRLELARAVESPLPPGPIAVHMAWRLPSSRNWVALWKPTGDAMGPVVGESRYPEKEFHPDDDRITKLRLHRCVDDTLEQRVVEVGLWWSLGS